MTAPDVPAEPIQPDRASRRSGGWLNALLTLALLVAVGGVAFAIGRSTAPAAATAGGPAGRVLLPGGSFDPGASFAPGAPRGGAGGPRGFLAQGGVSLSGTIEAIDADSVSLRLDDGTLLELALDEATDFHLQADADAADVTEGSQVRILVDDFALGAGNSPSADGTIGTAGDITVVP
jgi:hypothetical protein